VTGATPHPRWRLWIGRYLPAEIVALTAAVLVARLGWSWTGSIVVSALAGAWGETVVYYTVIIGRDLIAMRRALERVSLRNVLGLSRNLLLEFGVAEAVDSLLLRPALMYAAAQFVTDLSLSIIVGKLLADLTFYVPTVIAYELRRQYAPSAYDAPKESKEPSRSKLTGRRAAC
jgi:hypothetical protein